MEGNVHQTGYREDEKKILIEFELASTPMSCIRECVEGTGGQTVTRTSEDTGSREDTGKEKTHQTRSKD